MWNTVLYLFLGLLGLLLVLLIVPVYVNVTFHDELRFCVRVFGIPVFRYTAEDTSPSKATPPVKKTADKPSRVEEAAKRLKADSVGAVLDLVKRLTKLAAGAARRILAAVTVDKLRLQLIITGADAAAAAENTGNVCAALYPAVTALQQTVLRIKRREITVIPDFLGERARTDADMTVHAVPLRVAAVAAWLFFKYSRIHKEVFANGKQGAKSDGSVH